MKIANVFQLEIASVLSRRRAFVMRLGLPFLLGGPFCLIAMPVKMKASGLVMLVLFLTFLGSSVAATRRRSNGKLERLKILPIPPWLVWLDHMLASAAMDLMQLTGVFVLYIIINVPSGGIGGSSVLAVAGWLCVVVVLLNILGMLLAKVVADNAEVHLLGAICVGLLAVGSGLFPMPDRISGFIDATASVSPVGMLASQLIGMVDASYTTTPAQMWIGGIIGAALMAVIGLRSLNVGAAFNRQTPLHPDCQQKQI